MVFPNYKNSLHAIRKNYLISVKILQISFSLIEGGKVIIGNFLSYAENILRPKYLPSRDLSPVKDPLTPLFI